MRQKGQVEGLSLLLVSSVEDRIGIVHKSGFMEDGSTLCRHTNSFIAFHADLTNFTSMTCGLLLFSFPSSLGTNQKGGNNEKSASPKK